MRPHNNNSIRKYFAAAQPPIDANDAPRVDVHDTFQTWNANRKSKLVRHAPYSQPTRTIAAVPRALIHDALSQRPRKPPSNGGSLTLGQRLKRTASAKDDTRRSSNDDGLHRGTSDNALSLTGHENSGKHQAPPHKRARSAIYIKPPTPRTRVAGSCTKRPPHPAADEREGKKARQENGTPHNDMQAAYSTTSNNQHIHHTHSGGGTNEDPLPPPHE